MATRTPKDGKAEEKGPREVVPEFFSSDTGEGLPRIDASPAFIYAHHRKRWCVRDGKFVPELSKIPLVSGCNRILRAPDGKIRFADTQAQLQDRHFKLIPPALAPNGRTYLQEVETLPEGASAVQRAVITVWETAHPGESHTEWDFPGYVQWLESLVANGHIAPCTPHRAGEMANAARSNLRRAELRLSQNKANSTERVEALRLEVAALDKAAKIRLGGPVKAKSVSLDLDDGGAS